MTGISICFCTKYKGWWNLTHFIPMLHFIQKPVTGLKWVKLVQVTKIFLILKDYDFRTSKSGFGKLEGGIEVLLLTRMQIAIKITKDASTKAVVNDSMRKTFPGVFYIRVVSSVKVFVKNLTLSKNISDEIIIGVFKHL